MTDAECDVAAAVSGGTTVYIMVPMQTSWGVAVSVGDKGRIINKTSAPSTWEVALITIGGTPTYGLLVFCKSWDLSLTSPLPPRAAPPAAPPAAFPHVCSECGAPAYNGLNIINCSSTRCRHYKKV